MAYSLKEKKEYLKQKKAHDAKNTGKPFLTFGRWLGRKCKKDAPKKKAKSAYQEYDTVRTRGISRKAKEAGLTEKELKRMRGR